MSSETPVVPAAPSASAKPLTAIQTIEQELGKYIQQREQMIANLHAMEGAIQAAQQLLGRLKAAEAEAAKAAQDAAEKASGAPESPAPKVVEFAKKEA